VTDDNDNDNDDGGDGDDEGDHNDGGGKRKKQRKTHLPSLNSDTLIKNREGKSQSLLLLE